MTAKEQKFCDEFLIDLNATQAAIRAGYSQKTAAVIACKLLVKANIQEEIGKKRANLAKKVEITQEMILEGYRKLAFYDARKFYDDKGNLINIKDLDDETAFALSGFEVNENLGLNSDQEFGVTGYTKKIKMSGRRDAMDSICRVLGYNAPTKQEIAGKDGDPLLTPLNDDQVEKIIKALRETKTT